jgi:hypothetical protein
MDRPSCLTSSARPGLPAKQRQRVRQSAARPLIDDLAAFLDASLAMISGRSELAKAIRYARSRWTALTRYLDDGMLEISNNAAERAIRPLALGRKNYLFARSYAGGERAAIAYALIEPPSSTASIQKPICARWSAVSPTISSTASPNCCPGTSALHRRSALQPDICHQFGGRASGTSCASLVSE